MLKTLETGEVFLKKAVDKTEAYFYYSKEKDIIYVVYPDGRKDIWFRFDSSYPNGAGQTIMAVQFPLTYTTIMWDDNCCRVFNKKLKDLGLSKYTFYKHGNVFSIKFLDIEELNIVKVYFNNYFCFDHVMGYETNWDLENNDNWTRVEFEDF